LTQKRRAKGLIRAYLERMTGLSRAQFTRMIKRYAKTGRIAADRSPCHRFPLARGGRDDSGLSVKGPRIDCE
jgi:hypothetical protein